MRVESDEGGKTARETDDIEAFHTCVQGSVAIREPERQCRRDSQRAHAV